MLPATRYPLPLALLALTLFALTATGCDSDLDEDDILITTVPLQVAGVPVIELPATGNPRFDYTGSANSSRYIVYRHSGSSAYSIPITRVDNELGVTVAGRQDREFLSSTEFYLPSVINQDDIHPPTDGQFYLTATYKTYSPNFSEPDGLRTRESTRPFRICPFGNPSCADDGNARTSLAGAGSAAWMDEADQAERTTYECPPDDDHCNDTTGGGGGGGTIGDGNGSSGNTVQWFQTYQTHTAAMGPFFASSGVGSSASQGEIEDILEGLSYDQLDGIADIIEEAYGEDVHDYLGVPPSDARSAGQAPVSSFAEVLAPLMSVDRSAVTGLRALYLDRLARFAQRYTAARADGELAKADLATGDRTSAPVALASVEKSAITVWPNPATADVSVRATAGARIHVYDLVGRRVATLTADGSGTARWDARSEAGVRVAPGLYRVVATDEAGARRSASLTVL